MKDESENYKYLESKISNLSDELKEPIREIEINKDKKLFLVRNNYELLPPQILIHDKIRLDEDTNKRIISEMINSVELLNFLCINFQNFLGLLEKPKKFNKVLDENFDHKKITEMENNIATLDEQFRDLKIVKLFGFMSEDYMKNSRISSEKSKEFLIYELLAKYYKKEMRHYIKNFDFIENILKPIKNISKMLSLKENEHYKTDNKTYIFFNPDSITEESVQNFLSCLQYHTFFEDYINSKLNVSTNPIRNPIILINPCDNYRKKENKHQLEGYTELDGTLIAKDGKIILVECKNSRNITEDHLIKLSGKASLIEKVYGIKTKKLIFSTGYRKPFCKNLEKYPDLKDIQIFDINDFRNGFKKLEKLLIK